ncbi:MAG: hypothetical protein QN717_06555 [Nitrososphaeraceae archaeon]|nr:hypothetical protein [Nitrososphaeraceae archaeon]
MIYYLKLDFVVTSISIGLGAIASVVFRQIRNQRIAKMYNKKKSTKQAYSFDTSKNSTDLEMMKNELDSLQVERSIIAGSARRVDETFKEGKLSQLEFDRLMLKYGDDLRKCDEEIEHARSVVDLYDLSAIKNNLVSIIEDKIKVIDTRLTELSNRNFILTTTAKRTRPDIIKEDFANSSLRQENLDYSLRTEAEKIKNLEMEINQALEKLDSFESTKSGPGLQLKPGAELDAESKLKSKIAIELGKEEILKNSLGSSDKQDVATKRDPLRNFAPSK